jgi:YHS domain-containing protein
MKKMLVLSIISAMYAVGAFAQKAAVFNDKGVAVHGYDVVAYFTKSKPVKGDSKLAVNWNNATWYFADQQDLALFKANPEKYAPQYGGYCAYGVSDNHKAPTKPEAWSIVNGKLYLNYNTDVQADWKKEQAKRIADADKNWQAIKDKE